MKVIPIKFDDTPLDLKLTIEGLETQPYFSNVGEFKQWVADEKAFWLWLYNLRISNLDFIHHTFQSEFKSCIDNCDKAIKDLSDAYLLVNDTDDKKAGLLNYTAHVAKFCQRITQTIETDCNKTRWHLYRGRHEAIQINKLSQNNKAAAFAALVQVLDGGSTNLANLGYEAGHVYGVLIRDNLLGTGRKEEAEYCQIINNLKLEIEVLRANYRECDSKLTGLHNSKTIELEAFHKNSTETARKIHVNLQELLDQSDSRAKASEAAYNKLLQLRKPMEYWRAKSSEHAGQVLLWLTLCGLMLTGTCISLFYLASALLPVESPNTHVPWQAIGLFLVFSTIAIAILRVCIKLLLSHIHLQTDAREREVMIMTYMALVNAEEGKLAKEHLAVLLTPIFRPATAGVINDDWAPATAMEMISKQLKS